MRIPQRYLALNFLLIFGLSIHPMTVIAQNPTPILLDTVYMGGEGYSSPCTLYEITLPTTAPGILCISGNTYGQPDWIELLDSTNTVLFDGGYIGAECSGTDNCTNGPVVWINETTDTLSLLMECFPLPTTSNIDTGGAWVLLWETEQMRTIRLRVRASNDGSSWSIIATWHALPAPLIDCNRIGISSAMNDTLWYIGNSVDIPVLVDCYDYVYHIESPIDTMRPLLAISPTTVAFGGEPVTISINNDGSHMNWYWPDQTPFQNPTTLLVDTDREISLRNDCFVLTDTVYVSRRVYLPNVFAPDSGNSNSTWAPHWGLDSEPDNYQWQIFDRFGSLIAVGGPGNTWDGTRNGTPLIPGVYVGHITVNGKNIRSTSITLIR